MQVIAGSATDLSALDGIALLGLRADIVSATTALLVGFIGWIVMRYSRSYLDGEEREGAFHALMLTTLASVMVFVQAGSLTVLVLATIAVGLTLKKLLLFYPERAEARRAATKFGLVWHAGDVLLVIATGLVFSAYGTVDLTAISQSARELGLGYAGG